MNIENVFYEEKVPKIWQNSTINVKYIKSLVYSMCHECQQMRGIEIELFTLILEHLNILGNFSSDDTLLVHHLSKEQPITIGSLMLDILTDDHTVSYIQDSVVWFVPSPNLIPRWRYILSTFSINLWMVWILVVIIQSVAWFLNDLLLGEYNASSFLSGIISNWVLFLEQGYHFKTKFLSTKFMVLSIVVLAYMMNMFFKTRMTYLLNGLNHEKSIYSFEEIMQKKLRVGFTSPFMSDMITTSEEIRTYIKMYGVDCTHERLTSCLKRAALQKDLALLYTSRKIRYNKTYYTDVNTGQLLLQELSPPVLVAHFQAPFQLGHPMFPLFNRKLTQLIESGVIGRIVTTYDKPIEWGLSNLDVTKNLTFDNVVAPLFLWIIGIVLGVLVLSWERKEV